MAARTILSSVLVCLTSYMCAAQCSHFSLSVVPLKTGFSIGEKVEVVITISNNSKKAIYASRDGVNYSVSRISSKDELILNSGGLYKFPADLPLSVLFEAHVLTKIDPYTKDVANEEVHTNRLTSGRYRVIASYTAPQDPGHVAAGLSLLNCQLKSKPSYFTVE